MRALREGEAATFARLAAVADLHVTTIRERAMRESWRNEVTPRRKIDVPAEGLVPVEALFAAGGTEGAVEDNELAGLPPEERLARLVEFVVRQVETILTGARGGRIDKARIDAVTSMIRMVERAQNFAREQAEAQETRSDENLAEIVARIDAQIITLARAYAEQLVAERAGS